MDRLGVIGRIGAWARRVKNGGFQPFPPDDGSRAWQLWQAWEAMPYPSDAYPPASPEGTVDGLDLALFGGDLAFAFQHSFAGGHDARSQLAGMRAALERVVPQLRGEGAQYFSAALATVHEFMDTEDRVAATSA